MAEPPGPTFGSRVRNPRGPAQRHTGGLCRGVAHQRRPRELARGAGPSRGARVRGRALRAAATGTRDPRRAGTRVASFGALQVPAGSLPPPALSLLLGHDALQLSLERVTLDVALILRRREPGAWLGSPRRAWRRARRRARRQRRRARHPALAAPRGAERHVRERVMRARVCRARGGP